MLCSYLVFLISSEDSQSCSVLILGMLQVDRGKSSSYTNHFIFQDILVEQGSAEVLFALAVLRKIRGKLAESLRSKT